ncbi:MAG: methyltransferase domain-containing protein [Methyloligellaceae bacterium]
MLEFDAKTGAILEDAYQGSDIVKRRMLNLDALSPKAGETIADLGCGPGFMTMELSRAVGPDGKVIGIDPAADMRKTASERCAGRDNVRIESGTVLELPLSDSSIDKAVSVQVFEYVDDIPSALREVHRVLRPEGLVVIGDMHWDTLVWHSEDPERMERVIKAWDAHFVERRVPAILPNLMRENGFTVETITPLTFMDTSFRADGMAKMLFYMAQQFVLNNNLLEPAEVEAWAEEQLALAEQGKFFFSFTHIVVTGRKV